MTRAHACRRWDAARVCALLALSLPARAQTTSVIAGVVRDSASALGINGADVAISGTTSRARTSADGSYRLLLPSGDAPLLEVRRLGYRPAFVTLHGTASEVDVVMAPVAQPLAPVMVRAQRGGYTGRLAGYYERLEHHAQGVFITRADIEREHPPQLTDLLQRSAGVHVSRGRPGAQGVRMRGRNCRPLTWIDGAPLSAVDVDLDTFSPTSLEGIELYFSATSTPPRYLASRGQSECGTILLWTRSSDAFVERGSGTTNAPELAEQVTAHAVYTSDEVDVPATMTTDGVVVEYPVALRAGGASGVVLAEFIVGVDGGVEENSIGIVSETDPMFGDAVRSALHDARFTPARRRGVAVRQLVRLPFAFQPQSRAGRR